jgi:hypothetical protein
MREAICVRHGFADGVLVVIKEGRWIEKSLSIMISSLSRYSSAPLRCSGRASVFRAPHLLIHEIQHLQQREICRRGVLLGGVERSFGTGDESAKGQDHNSKAPEAGDDEGGMIWGVAFFSFCLGIPLLTMASDVWGKYKTDKTPWERRKSALKSWF